MKTGDIIFNEFNEWVYKDENRSGHKLQVIDASDLPEIITKVVKNLALHEAINQRELLFYFIAAVKNEFKDQNWDYLSFIAKRIMHNMEKINQMTESGWIELVESSAGGQTRLGDILLDLEFSEGGKAWTDEIGAYTMYGISGGNGMKSFDLYGVINLLSDD